MKFGVDGSVFFGLSPNYFQGVCGLGGEGMCVDGSVDMDQTNGLSPIHADYVPLTSNN